MAFLWEGQPVSGAFWKVHWEDEGRGGSWET